MLDEKGAHAQPRFSKEEKRRFRRALLDERSERRKLLRNLERMGLSDTETGAIGELSSYDQHPADHGTETFERERDVGLREEAKRTLDKIDWAMTRLDEGKYGTCEACGRTIPKERLEALPYATTCVDCAEDAMAGDLSGEEAALAPAFGRSFTDGTDNVVYDGEDAWQDLARYGTAKSPQDIGGEGGDPRRPSRPKR